MPSIAFFEKSLTIESFLYPKTSLQLENVDFQLKPLWFRQLEELGNFKRYLSTESLDSYIFAPIRSGVINEVQEVLEGSELSTDNDQIQKFSFSRISSGSSSESHILNAREVSDSILHMNFFFLIKKDIIMRARMYNLKINFEI